MNYSVLLPRSVDFDEFAEILYPSLPGRRSAAADLRPDAAAVGPRRARRLRAAMTTNPLPDTPAHQVLLDVAFGDHQVTDYQADVEARTIGASAHRPVLYKGRWPNTNVLWNVPAIKAYPFTGSAIYYWDIGPIRESPPGSGKFVGTEPPPYENLPNRTGEDPHGAAARDARPSSSSCRTSSTEPSRKPTTANAGLLRGQLHRAVGLSPAHAPHQALPRPLSRRVGEHFVHDGARLARVAEVDHA